MTLANMTAGIPGCQTERTTSLKTAGDKFTVTDTANNLK